MIEEQASLNKEVGDTEEWKRAMALVISVDWQLSKKKSFFSRVARVLEIGSWSKQGVKNVKFIQLSMNYLFKTLILPTKR